MRVCVIGNSHVGMLIKSLAEVPQDDLTCLFFAASGVGPDAFVIDGNGVLTTGDPRICRQFGLFNMPTTVDLAACDLIVIVAMTATLFHVKPLLGEHLVYGWPGFQALAGAMENPCGSALPQPILSEAAFVAGLPAHIRISLACRFVVEIRKRLAVPILIVREPAPSEALFDHLGKHPFLRRIARSGDLLAAAVALAQAHKLAFAGVDGLQVLVQPDVTLTPQGLTARAYRTGAVRLNVRFAQPVTDMIHVNAGYGGLVWQQIRAAGAQLPSAIPLNSRNLPDPG